jgi:hypothetical protein
VSVQRFDSLGYWLAEVKDSTGVKSTKLMALSDLELIDSIDILMGIKAKVVDLFEKINEPGDARDLAIKFLRKVFKERLDSCRRRILKSYP